MNPLTEPFFMRSQLADRHSKRVSHFTLLTSRKGGEWCARLHQRENDQDWKVYRGDEKNGSRDCEGVWRVQKYSA